MKNLDGVKHLTGEQYLTYSHRDLLMHPDFSPHAYRIIQAIGKMTTKDIEQINLIRTIGGTNRG
jgi:hypothetical protein